MNESAHVINVTIENFNSEVADKSKQTPVLIEFWAEDAQPSRELTPVLLRLVDQYQGKFLLARVNIAENAPLVQQLGVRTLPTLKLVVGGQIVQNLEGPQDETKLRALLDQVTSSPVERIREEINRLIAEGDREGAISMLQQVIEDEPTNYGLHTELCDLLIMVGREDEARQILGALPKDAEGIGKPQHRLEFRDLAAGLPGLDELMREVEADPENLQTLLNLAIVQVVDDDMEAALLNLLSMLQKDREFQEDIARKTMIKVFDLLGKGNALATEYRRKMFNVMH
jgi:putative thioredoxin|tara:strand:- start:127 stop:981 length:855 start_codon:yes stop_codon:yes gene_type:complete